jgi:sulfite exporter TauE/SafE
MRFGAAMSLAQFWLMFALGLVSSVHCVQMCGPIVLSYSLPLAQQAVSPAKAHFWYNLGRITTYTTLGALAGAAGGAIGLATRLAGIAHGSRIAAGVAMIIAGIYLLGLVKPGKLIRIDSPGVAARLARSGKRCMLSIEPASKFRLGLAFGLLPCGLIYAALLKAVDAGSAWGGALTMLGFGLGTSIALGATGLASTAFGWRLGRWSNALAGLSVVFAGALLVWMGIAPDARVHHHAHF